MFSSKISRILHLLAVSLTLVSITCAVGPQAVFPTSKLSTAPLVASLIRAHNASQVHPLHLSSIGSGGFTALSHPSFPNHRVRVKKSHFCDPTVNVYTGYLDVDAGAKHMFFYFFESRRNPEKDDVMMWINGGPGCSSAVGLLLEMGPCSIDMQNLSNNGTIWNPYSWNAEANIFFLDQPVGVGFSYADYGETVETTEDAAKNVHAFVSIFFATFPQFSGRPLHLSGESYAGRYLPVFASEIYDKNQIAVQEGRPAINLQSVLIGNGVTDISTLHEGRYEVECGTVSLPVPFQSISVCVRMKTALPRCKRAMRESCIDQFDAMNCRAAVKFCDSELSSGMRATGRNPYDISKPCDGNHCYRENDAIISYLNQPEIRELLGIETTHNFTLFSDTVKRGFNTHVDKWAVHTQDYVANLLDRGVRVLIYAGTYDWQSNWVANKRWVEKLEWSGHSAYAAGEWRNWSVGGKKVGEVKQTSLLTFATIRGAGHLISTFPYITIKYIVLTPFFLSPVSTSLMINLQKLWRWYQDGLLRKNYDLIAVLRNSH